MSLVDHLRSRAIELGFLDPTTEITPGTAFHLVRDMPYMRASSRLPETTIQEWRGTCSGKHYLLKLLFAELGLQSRVMACTTEFRPEPESLPSELREILGSSGVFVDVHNYLVVELSGGEMVVDATWPADTKPLGFPVNESFVLGQDQQIACVPKETWAVPPDSDPQAFKDLLLKEHFTPEQLAQRDQFIQTMGLLLEKRSEGRT